MEIPEYRVVSGTCSSPCDGRGELNINFDKAIADGFMIHNEVVIDRVYDFVNEKYVVSYTQTLVKYKCGCEDLGKNELPL